MNYLTNLIMNFDFNFNKAQYAAINTLIYICKIFLKGFWLFFLCAQVRNIKYGYI